MNHQRHSDPRAGPAPGKPRPALNVAIAYDTRRAATRVMQILGPLVRKLGDESEFDCSLWRFDVLGLPDLRSAALAAGRRADLFILSARCEAGVPWQVRDWLEASLRARMPHSAGLIGLLEGNLQTGVLTTETGRWLQTVADRHSIDFFLQEFHLPASCPPLALQDVQTRANTVSSVLEGILSRTVPPERLRA